MVYEKLKGMDIEKICKYFGCIIEILGMVGSFNLAKILGMLQKKMRKKRTIRILGSVRFVANEINFIQAHVPVGRREYKNV